VSAKENKTQTKNREKNPVVTQIFGWPFGRINLILLIAGLLVIVLGYVFLSQGPADSVQSLTIAPILLLFGYMVLLPASIMVSKVGKRKKQQEGPAE